MGTSYDLISKDGVTVVADEASNEIGIDIWTDGAPGDQALAGSTGTIFNGPDLMKIIVGLIKVHSYWFEDTKTRLMNALDKEIL
jgi:hypothetical protein